MIHRTPTRRDPNLQADDFTGQPTQGMFPKWVLGVGVPALLLTLGVMAIVQQSILVDQKRGTVFKGIDATAAGTGLVSVAIFMHSHYFWGNIYDQTPWAVIGKIIGLIGFIASTGVLMVRVAILGR